MLKRPGVKRAVRVAQIVKGVEGTVEYRAHEHPDIPDSEKPMTMLGNIAAAFAKAVDYLGDRTFLIYMGMAVGLFRGRRGRGAFAPVLQHRDLHTLFPHLKGNFAFPEKRQPPTGREAYRLSRARIRGRFQHRARYRKERMPAGLGLVPVTLADLSDEMSEADLTLHTQIMQEAAFRAGVLTPAEGYEVLETGEWP